MEERKRKVLVLMSTYNGEKFLRDQIDSILNQTIRVNILVRDDGSSDSTCKILDIYHSQGKLDWYTGDNLKPAKSFMDLLMRSGEYDYYAFSDQDDIWKKDKLEKSIAEIETIKEHAICYTNAEIVDEKLNSLNRVVYPKKPSLDLWSLMCGPNIIGCTMVFNKKMADIVKKHGIPDKIMMHDSYMGRVCVAIGGSIVFKDECTILYRQHGNNAVGAHSSAIKKIRNRLNGVLRKAKVTIDEQAREILDKYGDEITYDNRIILISISNYNKRIKNRIALFSSKYTHYPSISLALMYRIAILFGNR